MKYVLDTDVVSRVLDGDERALSALTAVEEQDVGIPLLVLAELLSSHAKTRGPYRVAPHPGVVVRPSQRMVRRLHPRRNAHSETRP